ncbi:MAG: transcriptional regulator [Planctomycetaceae bacterium]|nr:transcriptional regulator [Planctomycetaceae bacterium]
MSTAPRFTPADTDELPKDMMELGQLLAGLPPQYRMALEPVWDRVVESTRRRRRILTLVQEALSQLRLDMKYLVFDLEATRRERDAYRQNSGDDGQAE